MSRYFAPAIAISTGLLVLLGYFLPLGSLAGLRVVIVHWAVVLSGAAVFVGVLNLLSVHVKKIRTKEKNNIYSLLLIASLLFTLVLGMISGSNSSIMSNIFNTIILPVEASLMAIMAVTLIYASIRLLRKRNDLMSIVFLSVAVLVMLGSAPLPFIQLPLFGDLIRPKIVNVFATSGARGILIGVALGTLLTGLRVLMGVDRPYGGK
ncbi:MAG: hypothetical protein HN855_00830 [Anaerolineae bacterium]|jgi:hypothetical protein|nr:hypothetical protein [Anaerolineae bacterium]MBT7070803.1 hypothetical protein [Anaerolineae bacterium]MBT7323685.1 hypothetical protein [Anaerolineae bacterium]